MRSYTQPNPTRQSTSSSSLPINHFNYSELRERGYQDKHIIAIMNSKKGDPAEVIPAIINGHPILKNDYTVDDIISMACSKSGGGVKNINSLAKHHQFINDKNLDKEYIVAMLSQVGGSLSLQALVDYHDAVLALQFPGSEEKFSSNDILLMVKRKCTALNVKAVYEYFGDLTRAGLSKSDIMSVAVHQSAADTLQNLSGYIEKINRIMTELNSTLRLGKVIRMCSCDSGYLNAEAVIDYYKELKSFGYQHEGIIQQVSMAGGHKVIKRISVLHNHLVSSESQSHEASVKMVKDALYSARLDAEIERRGLRIPCKKKKMNTNQRFESTDVSMSSFRQSSQGRGARATSVPHGSEFAVHAGQVVQPSSQPMKIVQTTTLMMQTVMILPPAFMFAGQATLMQGCHRTVTTHIQESRQPSNVEEEPFICCDDNKGSDDSFSKFSEQKRHESRGDHSTEGEASHNLYSFFQAAEEDSQAAKVLAGMSRWHASSM